MKMRLSLILTFWLALCGTAFAQTETGTETETITDYDVDIIVRENGSIEVIEEIAVDVKGVFVKRGIFRTLPRYLEMDDGTRLPQQYKIISITRNGEKEPYKREGGGNAVTYRIGDGDVLLEKELQTYRLHYELPYVIRRNDTEDELYWNAIGSYWNFPIEGGTITVRFPNGADAKTTSTYVGKTGAAGSDAEGGLRQRRQVDGSYAFDLTRELDPGEGATVSLIVPKGVINPPDEAEKRYFWWRKNGAGAIVAGLLAALAAFYSFAWAKVGRDPVKKAVIPLYGPPEGYSPAAVSYIFYRGVRKYQPLIASFLNMSIADVVKIETAKKKTTITALKGSAEMMSAEEEKLFEDVLGRAGQSVTLSKSPNPSFHKAVMAFHKDLAVRFSAPYHKGNAGFGCLGIVAIIVALFVGLGTTGGNMPGWGWAALAAAVVMTGVAFKLIAAPTELGQRVRTEIEGFRLYLNTAEKLALNAAKVGGGPPPMTTERYERFLPYAIALDVEKPWTEYFEKALPREAQNFQMRNASGDFHTGSGVSNMTKALVTGMAAGVAAAAPASSSSSGGGGGGSVGGGGGGGGGGGW